MPAGSTFDDRVNGISASVAQKAPCRAATTVNITLSGAQTVDGVAVVAEDRVLVKDQTTGSENGIYVVKDNAWVLAKDFDGARDVRKGTMVRVTDGTVNDNTYWSVATENEIVPGTTSINFVVDNNVLGEGVLEEGVVTLESLSAEVLALIQAGGTFRGAWLTATAYAVGDAVAEGGFVYMSTVAHTSGVFATDLAAGKWVKISATSLELGADIVSATALPVNVAGTFHNVTGGTTITSMASLSTGISILKVLRFAASTIITHHATNLILPGDSNITAEAGEIFVFYQYGAGTWRMVAGNGIAYSPGLIRALYCNDYKVIRAELQDYAETTATPSSAGGSLTIDLSAGNVQSVTLTEDVTIVFSNPPGTGKTGSVTLILTQDATGGRDVSYSSTVKWSAGEAPTLSQTAGAIDILTFFTKDGGTTWFGFPCGIGMAVTA